MRIKEIDYIPIKECPSNCKFWWFKVAEIEKQFGYTKSTKKIIPHKKSKGLCGREFCKRYKRFLTRDNSGIFAIRDKKCGREFGLYFLKKYPSLLIKETIK